MSRPSKGSGLRRRHSPCHSIRTSPWRSGSDPRQQTRFSCLEQGQLISRPNLPLSCLTRIKDHGAFLDPSCATHLCLVSLCHRFWHRTLRAYLATSVNKSLKGKWASLACHETGSLVVQVPNPIHFDIDVRRLIILFSMPSRTLSPRPRMASSTSSSTVVQPCLQTSQRTSGARTASNTVSALNLASRLL